MVLEVSWIVPLSKSSKREHEFVLYYQKTLPNEVLCHQRKMVCFLLTPPEGTSVDSKVLVVKIDS